MRVSELRLLFSVTPEGNLVRLKSARKDREGEIAGSPNSDGYINIRVGRKMFKAHRIVWALTRGEWPSKDIDHANGNRADNRPENLREATKSENKANSTIYCSNTSGYKGVVWSKSMKKWCSRKTVFGERKVLGYFQDPELAGLVYDSAAERFYNKFSRTNGEIYGTLV